ncbi:hypothetical protein EV127DRAFT_369327 [Xylaria flabelliformis]|nr:hypothetical protein EV127DRAFT_369327 [Xylaria flabelliformis]
MAPKKRGFAEAQSESRRRSTRVSSIKSSYFEEDEDDVDDSESPPRKTTKTTARSQVEASDDDEDQYEEDDVDDDEEEEDVGDGDVSDGDDSATPPPKVRDGDEDENDNSEDDDGSDGPDVTFIPLPKLRDTDGVDYEDTKVHPNTLLFLGDLKANNKRSWLKMHDPEYRRSLKDWESFVETLTEKIIEADETIPELPLKDVIFRIYRDIRFSKDPTPYKPHYSAAWSRTGRKGPYACYYVHIEPGYCLVGGGLWHPEAAALARLRASVDERPHRIRRVLTDPEFVRVFLPHVVGKKEDKILKAFADKNQENALKTKPKGFNPDHRDIQLLKLRNYTIGRQIPEEDILSDNAQEKIMEAIRAMVPFVTFLNNVVMPDPGADSDSDEDDGEEQDVEDEEEQDVDDEDEEDEE